jgi:hypothetical protein
LWVLLSASAAANEALGLPGNEGRRTACTNAVVASCVVLVPGAAVGPARAAVVGHEDTPSANSPTLPSVAEPSRAAVAGGLRPVFPREPEVRTRPAERPVPRAEERGEASHDRVPVPEPRPRREERRDDRRETDGRSSGWSPGSPRLSGQEPVNPRDRTGARPARNGRSGGR